MNTNLTMIFLSEVRPNFSIFCFNNKYFIEKSNHVTSTKSTKSNKSFKMGSKSNERTVITKKSDY
jgi:hypothetical protein